MKPMTSKIPKIPKAAPVKTMAPMPMIKKIKKPGGKIPDACGRC